MSKSPNSSIVYDTRAIWCIESVIRDSGGVAINSKTGHAIIKAKMRESNALYGGELSAHHYFRDFAYCDSGVIPLLLVAEILADLDMPLSILVDKLRTRFPSSGEINFQVNDQEAVLRKIQDKYKDLATDISYLDGISLSFDNWRFNARISNTEPLLRLNVEALGNTALLNEKLSELEKIIKE